MESFNQQLKNLKQLAPDENYSRQSLMAILAHSQNDVKNELGNKSVGRLVGWTAAALTIAIVMSATFYYFLIFKNNLLAEASQINDSIQVNLSRIQYQLNNNKQISPIEAQKIRIILNQVNKDLEDAKNISNDSKKISAAVGKIKDANQLLLQINLEIK